MTAWDWPQWVYLGFILISAVAALVNHGEPRKGKYDFGLTLASCFITAWVLWMGGFWS